MNLHDLETFVSIAQLGGVTRAAGRLHRSQPAITRRINLLEDQLGAPLFERGRGGAMLTEAGRTFLPYAQAILAALKDGTQAVQALQGEGHGAVSLAIVGTLQAPPSWNSCGVSRPDTRMRASNCVPRTALR